MTLLMALTDPQKVKYLFGSNQFDFINNIKMKLPEEINTLTKDMKFDLSYGADELLMDIITGEYSHADGKNGGETMNFNYGLVYWQICRYYGEQLDENEFFHEQYVNFIFDKFPKELYDGYNGKYFFPLPKFDFPVFISLDTEEILRLEVYIKRIDSYKTDYVQLDENELDNLKNMFLKALNLAKEKNMGIVFRLDD